RLKELRTAIGLQEYHELTGRLQEETAVLERLRAALEEKAGQAMNWELETRRLEETLGRLEEDTRAHESSLGTAREQIAAEETTLSHERSLLDDWEADLSRMRSALLELTGRVNMLAGVAQEAAGALQEAETLSRSRHQELEQIESYLQAAVSRLADLN